MMTVWTPRDEQPHDDVAADQACQRVSGVALRRLRMQLLALLDERDGGEDAELHEGHGQDARHEEAAAPRLAVWSDSRCTASTGGRPESCEVRGADDAGRRSADGCGRARRLGSV